MHGKQIILAFYIFLIVKEPANTVYIMHFFIYRRPMGSVKSDIEIAREAKMKPIREVLAKLNVPNERHAFSPMSSYC